MGALSTTTTSIPRVLLPGEAAQALLYLLWPVTRADDNADERRVGEQRRAVAQERPAVRVGRAGRFRSASSGAGQPGGREPLRNGLAQFTSTISAASASGVIPSRGSVTTQTPIGSVCSRARIQARP